MNDTGPRRHFLFVSVNETPWGGSEELWARAALALAERGHTISVAKPNIDRNAAPIRALADRGVDMVDLASLGPMPRRLVKGMFFVLRTSAYAFIMARFRLVLRNTNADFVVVSQGGSWDAFHPSRMLERSKLPYATIAQKASELYWPPDEMRDRIRLLYLKARHCFFVSHHNHRMTEEQLGLAIPRADVVRNPFLTDYDAPLPWPEEGAVTDFACVGRLFPKEKGQDLVLRVLARPRWRERPVAVTFYGEGIQRQGLEAMARFLKLDNVRFAGHVGDVPGIWRRHPALLLASRAEGLPLVLVEAMLAGRIAVITDAGGSGEIVSDNETAFLAKSYDEDSLDDAMERAWQRRGEWQAIGEAARAAVREQVPRDPPGVLADRLEEIAGEGG